VTPLVGILAGQSPLQIAGAIVHKGPATAGHRMRARIRALPPFVVVDRHSPLVPSVTVPVVVPSVAMVSADVVWAALRLHLELQRGLAQAADDVLVVTPLVGILAGQSPLQIAGAIVHKGPATAGHRMRARIRALPPFVVVDRHSPLVPSVTVLVVVPSVAMVSADVVWAVSDVRPPQMPGSLRGNTRRKGAEKQRHSTHHGNRGR